ncbi:hypothetical protein [Lactobacillus delbrueckii]|uniref:hypothetical protein n=1 Tax=Lactobacillus delbrueckii TaxID=1584 RepID=UPI003A8C1DBB
MAESKSASVVFTDGSLLAKNAQAAAGSAKSAADNAYDLASSAQRTADGKNSIYRGLDPNTVPKAGLKVGDLYFSDNAAYVWNGSSWEETVSDTTGKEIHAKVEEAMAESKKSVEELDANIKAKVAEIDKEIEDNKIQTGNALNFYKEQYYLSNSYTELTGGSWSDEVPTKTKGKYVWSRYVTANVGDPTNQQYSDPVCISGLDGEQGPQGPQGLQGLQGPKGDQGVQGPQGTPSYTHIAYSNSADGKTDFDVGNGADKTYIGIYVDSNPTDSTDPTQYTWTLIKGADGADGIPGPKGADGRTPYFHVAYANSSDGAINFDVSNSDGKLYIGQYTDYTQADSTNPASYSWTKIKGETGPTGATGPQGPQGDAGPQGVPGPKGADGQTTYVHVAYADSADGKSNFSVNYFADALYIGVLTDYTQADSMDYTQYTWSRLKGDTGDQGIPGPKGDNGQTTYVHFAYANIVPLGIEKTNFTLSTQTVVRYGDEASGRWFYKDLPAGNYIANDDFFGDPALGAVKVAQAFSDFSVTESSARSYIGVYTDYTQDDSTSPASYSWTKIKGDAGQTGATGPKGDTGSTGFFIGTTPPPNPSKGTVWATTDSSGNMTSAETWNGSSWVSTAFTQDLVAGNITATKIQGGELDINKITVKNAQNIPIDSTVSLGKKLSDIKQDADGLTLTVKNKGQNLLRDTDTVPIWGGDKETVDNFTVVKAVMNWDGDSYDPIAWNNLTTIKPNTDYTLSFWAKADQPADIYSYLYNIGTDTVYMDGSTLSHLTTSYQRFEIHFQTQNFSDGRTVNCLPMRVITKNVTHYIYGCQLEEGTMATAWSPDPEDISALKVTSGSLNAYVKGSRGSKTLESILSMDPDHSSIAQVVNGQIAAAIGTYSDGTVRIDGKALYINSHAKIDDATIKSAMIESIEAEKIKTGKLNADEVDIINLTADKIASGTLNGMTITGSKFIANTDNGNLFGTLWKNYQVVVDNTEVNIHGRDSSSNDWESILTSDSLYLQMANDNNTWIKSIDISIVGQNPHINLVNSGPNPGQHSSTYIGSDGVRAPIGQLGNWSMQGSKVLAQSGSLYVANPAGGNFDGNGSVGFQVWSGIGLGKSTIYTPDTDIYIQQGNVGPALDQSYSSAYKTTIHAQKLISQVANTVASRLSVKTDITPVTYDRALAAVEGTEMYDYRYISDDSGQHYVSGIIDDVNPDPQYHMDDMLINKERTARIDANLVGYHHVVLQELLKKIDKLQAELTELKSKEK